MPLQREKDWRLRQAQNVLHDSHKNLFWAAHFILSPLASLQDEPFLNSSLFQRQSLQKYLPLNCRDLSWLFVCRPAECRSIESSEHPSMDEEKEEKRSIKGKAVRKMTDDGAVDVSMDERCFERIFTEKCLRRTILMPIYIENKFFFTYIKMSLFRHLRYLVCIFQLKALVKIFCRWVFFNLKLYWKFFVVTISFEWKN